MKNRDYKYSYLPVKIKTSRLIRPKLEVLYPKVVGMKDLSIQRKINKDIYSLVQEMIRDQGYYENPMTVIDATYQIKNNQNRVLSLSLINYAYAGGAHGLTIVKSLTFDLNTGKSYQLKELFKADSNYQERLSQIIAKDIVDRDIPILEEFEGIREDQDYYVADNTLVIYFQLYEITPYFYGLPCFPISVYEIKDIIDDSSPLGMILRCF
ncbi:Protein of unknown function (DUF3298) [Halobacteroides halobius DSM 5150]|uniref:DUF3298 domain-containing protein n=1 Tax=Halobacteroides halobius (strain ATCC 35273 / DSM 5150 / MD-1) TaxID=748449 RepID=L0K932_HALHC|nr:DUF3298 and DUF4163 domain-containing protein [Halobacteroides halobius]AGB41060.1 Protein of unknown function (DUF3298) [Halobacteroides halobius DSM 5150]